MTFSEAAELHKQRLAQNVSLKKRTRAYWGEVLSALVKSWPGLQHSELRKIAPTACREWAARYANGASATRFNNTVAVLRHVLDIAVESGVIYSNPAASSARFISPGDCPISMKQTAIKRPPYTIKAAAAYLSLSTKTISRLIKNGVLRSSTITRKTLIPAEDVENLAESTC